MNLTKPRVAFFACAYNEVDGVANTAHHFEDYAGRHELPFLSIHGGYESYLRTDGTITKAEFQRGWPSFPLDKKHDFDLLFWKHYDRAKALVHEFRPDLVHITGPSDVGMMGALIAHKLHLPLVASWHTNLHEYAARRAVSLFHRLPRKLLNWTEKKIETGSLSLLLRYYRIPRLLFAPNPELIDLLASSTGKPCFLMGRGVDLELFNPQRRERRDESFTLGYVGRITVEKNIGLLPELERGLLDAGCHDFRFLIVGQGAAEPWLRQHLQHAEFTGVLQGEALGRAYANMDVFVFPSQTDTFGNVVLEAMSSGVPAIVTTAGGPRFIVQHGKTGFVAVDIKDFVKHASWLMSHREQRDAMSCAAREYALTTSWDAVFDFVYEAYSRMLVAQAGEGIPSPTNAPDLGNTRTLMRGEIERS